MKDDASRNQELDSTSVESLIQDLEQLWEAASDAQDEAEHCLTQVRERVDQATELMRRLAKGYEAQAKADILSVQMLEGIAAIEDELAGSSMRAIVINAKGMPHNFKESGEIFSPFYKTRFWPALKRAEATTGLVYSPDMQSLAYDIKTQDDGQITYKLVNLGS